MVHSYPTGQLARRQIQIFKEEGVDLSRVKIDHSNDTTDTEYLQWILDQGCFLGWIAIRADSSARICARSL